LVEHGYQLWALQAGKQIPLSIDGTDYEGNALAIASE
jgi:hypothetical protein